MSQYWNKNMQSHMTLVKMWWEQSRNYTFRFHDLSEVLDLKHSKPETTWQVTFVLWYFIILSESHSAPYLGTEFKRGKTDPSECFLWGNSLRGSVFSTALGLPEKTQMQEFKQKIYTVTLNNPQYPMSLIILKGSQSQLCMVLEPSAII